MKLAIMIPILLILIGGCSKVQDLPSVPTINTTDAISGTIELVLNEQELQQLGMTGDVNEQDLEQLGLNNGTNCRTEDDYSNIVDSSLGQYSICAYNIRSLNNTQVIIELQKFADIEALNGSYQYQSSHLFSVQGLISENDFGDMSRFRVNNVNDYGGEFNPPGIYFYHLWIAKDKYLIHITSKGNIKEADESIAKIGRQILTKFE